MTPITVASLSHLEYVFDALLTDPCRVVYHNGVYYIICDAHLGDAMERFKQHRSSHQLMLAAQFAFCVEGFHRLILIKNRLTFEEVEQRLGAEGYAVVKDDGGCRVVKDV